MGNRDSRYDLIKPMLSEGKIVSFTDIFKYIPKTIVANDLGKKVDRFTVMMNQVEKFTLEELFKMAALCRLTKDQMFGLLLQEYVKKHATEVLAPE
ncbi:MAG TPA: hypothetical protein VGQ51_00170 [Puia sp.]|jgi:hypothetical protein|nr:hypothetical protein [Puia sp.]